jgi:hypothetical protein
MVAFVVCLVGCGVLQCGGKALWDWHSARHLRCPECAGELLHFYRLVVASRRCYHCGMTVLTPRCDQDQPG